MLVLPENKSFLQKLPMDKQPDLEELLNQRTKLLDKIKKQEDFLMELDALKRTLVKTLVRNDLYMGLPLSNYTPIQNFEPVSIQDEHPLFILNPGIVPDTASGTVSTHLPIPINLRILRCYKKSKLSKATRNTTWYTTTVIKKDGHLYFVIRDDENNIWKGHDIFHQFCQAFDSLDPFVNIEQWMGLDRTDVQLIVYSNGK